MTLVLQIAAGVVLGGVVLFIIECAYEYWTRLP